MPLNRVGPLPPSKRQKGFTTRHNSTHTDSQKLSTA